VKINYVNSSGSGFAEERELPEGMTIGEFAARAGVDNPDAYLIRRNGRIVRRSAELQEGDDVEISQVSEDWDAELEDGDRVTATRTNIKGATN